MNRKKLYKQYCIGCGICQDKNNTVFGINSKGFLSPNTADFSNDQLKFCDTICTASKKSLTLLDKAKIWGRYNSVYFAHSSDPTIREVASSGGVLTALSIYLLESGKVDGILHTGKSSNSVIETASYCSTTQQAIIDRCGSRYTISSPLLDSLYLMEAGKKYAFIGKPCDVSILKNYMKVNPKIGERIIYTLSFFCAGIPSKRANETLLNEMGNDERSAKELTYRGNGWPGKTVVTDYKERLFYLDYEIAWGQILGRDIHPFCRFCMDGIGESADIACGDAWYLNEDNQPDFSEHKGRNVVFLRSDLGEALFNEASEAGYIVKAPFGHIEKLKAMQMYQYDRKSTMFFKLAALKLLLKSKPPYPMRRLLPYIKYTTPRKASKIFLGTIKRVLQGRI